MGKILLILIGLVLTHTAKAQTLPVPETVPIPAGNFLAGSSSREREYAYRLDEAAYGHSNTRKWGWYDDEPQPASRHTDAYAITRAPITNRQYQAFTQATGHPVPDVDRKTWQGYRLIHPYERTRRHAWREGSFPPGRGDHPVVMVSWHDANAYAQWLSEQTRATWRLPTGAEWEKAIRGLEGAVFPWGNEWDPLKADSHDKGKFDTVPVGSNQGNVSPFGLTDAAGQVFEWTTHPDASKRQFVRGGSWDDSGCGVCRPAARHARPVDIKHILVGFRLVRELN